MTDERLAVLKSLCNPESFFLIAKMYFNEAIAEITRLHSALTARDEALKETVRSLENCLMLARREKNRKDTNARTLAAWTHVIRFCDEAGVEGSGILRGENDSLSALAATKIKENNA